MTQTYLNNFAAILLFVAILVVTAAGAQSPASLGDMPVAQLQTLAESGNPAAQNELGVRYRLGSDVEKDPTKAIPWFLRAARQGYAKAYFNLGAAYYNGDGVKVDLLNSCTWFIFSADAGDDRATEALVRTRQELSKVEMNSCETLAATVYFTGDPIKQDFGKAMKWYMAAANNGDGSACEKIAYLYDRGIGVAQDKQASFDWLRRSGDLNYPPALYELGLKYEQGGIVQQDVTRARKLFEQAAQLGQAQAFTALGRMYADGRGVKLDQQKALAYYLVGEGYGDAKAKPLAHELTARLSPKQVTGAKQDANKIALTSKRPLLLVRK